MITFKQAVASAREIFPEFDRCVEYEKGYLFAKSDSEGVGGSGSPLAILKEDGRAVGIAAFMREYRLHDELGVEIGVLDGSVIPNRREGGKRDERDKYIS